MDEPRIRQAVIVSDIHAGCQFGLCPPGDIQLDGGGIYRASPLVLKMWSWWEEFWGEWVPNVTRGEPYAVIVNGDSTDGRHHGTTTQISQNLSDQRKIAYSILRPIVEKCDGHFFMIRGTEAHTGAAGENEETLAQELGAIPDENGNYARNELWLRIGGRLAHILHQISTAGSAAYEMTALSREFAIQVEEAGRWGKEMPDFIIRAHRHRHGKIEPTTANIRCVVAVTPGWQLKTPLVWRLMTGKNTTPQCGGILIRTGDEEHYERSFVRNISRTPEVIL